MSIKRKAMSKSGQNYQNHRRWNPLHHFVTYGLLLILLVSSLVYAFSSCGNLITGLLFVLISIIIGLTMLTSRMFALKAQDRAIRAEENLRHFILSGKPFSSNLRLGQIIALRFASDEELIELAQRAEIENLKSSDIKRAIKNWRADYHRV